jgi:hypothetical protein
MIALPATGISIASRPANPSDYRPDSQHSLFRYQTIIMESDPGTGIQVPVFWLSAHFKLLWRFS